MNADWEAVERAYYEAVRCTVFPLVGLNVIGCSSGPPAGSPPAWRGIKKGMLITDVEKAAGPPLGTEFSGGAERSIWSEGRWWLFVHHQAGVVTRVEMEQAGRV